MRTVFIAGLAATLLTLAACGDDNSAETGATPPASTEAPAIPATPEPQSRTETEAREAGQAIEDAARQTGAAASSALRDLRDSAAPAMERAREEGSQALDSARQGLNNLTRGAACETARAADDAEGIAANC